MISAWGKSMSHKWKGWINRGEPCHKVFLNNSNGSFSGVAAMKVGRNMFILHVIGSEKVFQSGGCFVVKGLKFGFETLGCELLMDVVVCVDPFRGGPGLRWENFDLIAVKNITYHNVPVALVVPHRKFSRLIGVQLSLAHQDGINKMGFCARICGSCCDIFDV
jgi:hypothetical protein